MHLPLRPSFVLRSFSLTPNYIRFASTKSYSKISYFQHTRTPPSDFLFTSQFIESEPPASWNTYSWDLPTSWSFTIGFAKSQTKPKFTVGCFILCFNEHVFYKKIFNRLMIWQLYAMVVEQSLTLAIIY